VIDDTDFIRNFRTTDDCRERAIWVRKSFTENLKFFFDEKTGNCCVDMVCDTFCRCVCTVCCAERVVDEDVSEFRESFSELFVIFRFARIEADVL